MDKSLAYEHGSSLKKSTLWSVYVVESLVMFRESNKIYGSREIDKNP